MKKKRYVFRSLKSLMDKEIPNRTYQRRRLYRPNLQEVQALYRCINREIFYNKLTMPTIVIKQLQGAWGECEGIDGPKLKTRSKCIIRLADKWYCQQWLINTLAHEMVHQYQWDIYSKIREKRGQKSIMSHGPSFYIWRKKLLKFNIHLKETGDHFKWFKTQNIMDC